MEDPQLYAVLNFLTRHGFSTAASALREDAFSRGIDLAFVEDTILSLSPVKTTPVLVGISGSTSSSVSCDYVSIGASPSELRNPYGIWSSGSSVRNSEFGTAREYNESILFGDANWYGDQFGRYLDDPYLFPANKTDDKFLMPVEAEERFEENTLDFRGKRESCMSLGFSGLYGCSFSLCDCCKRKCGEKVDTLNSSSSVYGRFSTMDDETESLDDCEVDGGHLMLITESTEMIQCNGWSVNLDLGKDDQDLEPSSIEQNFQKFNENDINNAAFADVNGSSDLANMDKDFKDSVSLLVGDEDDLISNDLQVFTAHDDEFETFDLRIVHRKDRTGFEENKDFQVELNSVVAGRYYLTEYLSSATFSKVVQAHDLHTGADLCLKIIKNDKDFFDQSLDEIKLLKYVNKYDPGDQRHLLRLYDYFYFKEHLFIVCELLRANLYEFQKFNRDSGGDTYFTLHRIQAIARQCLEALEYLHKLKIIHCDLKPENILIKSYSKCEVKVIDFGSSCFSTDTMCFYVQSRSYRAPEIFLGLPYDEKIDLWSLGCILAELYTGYVLFLNDSPVIMLAQMIGILGSFDKDMLESGQEVHKFFTENYDLFYKNEEADKIECLIPEKSSLAYHLQIKDAAFLDFLTHLLQINPMLRFNASQALRHQWFSISYN